MTEVQKYHVDDDEDDDDAATEVQTNFCCLTKFYDARDYWLFIPPRLVILNATKPYQTWYYPLHVGVVATSRRECQRNYIKMFLGLWDFPPPLLIFLLLCCYFSYSRVKAWGNFLFLGKLASLLLKFFFYGDNQK